MKINNTYNSYNATKDLCPHLNLSNFLDLGLPPTKGHRFKLWSRKRYCSSIKNNWKVLSIEKENTESIIKESLNPQELNNFEFLK